MNYLIKTCILILFFTLNINANETINNKILFKLNNKVYTNIDLERRIKYIEITNNINYKALDDGSKDEVLNDFISSLIFNEYSEVNEILYENLNQEIEQIFHSIFLNKKKLNIRQIKNFKNNIKIDLIRKKVLEGFLNSKSGFLTKETKLLDLLYNYNLQYLIINIDDIENFKVDIKNRNEFLFFKKQLLDNKIPFIFKEDDLLDSSILSDEIRNLIFNNEKIFSNKNNNFLKIISIEKNLESYEGVFVKLVTYKSDIKLDENQLNCNYINTLTDKIEFKEYEYTRLNNQIKENLKSINNYILIDNENIYTYIFLCDLKYDKKILNEINFNKKVDNLINNLQIRFINKYKKEYKLQNLNE